MIILVIEVATQHNGSSSQQVSSKTVIRNGYPGFRNFLSDNLNVISAHKLFSYGCLLIVFLMQHN